MGKGLGKSPINYIINKDKQEVVSGKQNVRAACPKDKLEFKIFLALQLGTKPYVTGQNVILLENPV